MSEVADGPGDEGERATIGDRCREPLDRLGNGREHLLGPDDADMQIRDQRERAASLTRSRVEHDRAGVGDRQRAAGDHSVARVELGEGERRIVGERNERVGKPGRLQPGRDDEPRAPGGERRSAATAEAS